MNRREVIKGSAIVLTLPALGFYQCGGPSKDKAVKYAGLTIDILKDASPLVALLGSTEIAQLINDKAIPALEKLKDALGRTDIPTAGNIFETVQTALGSIATALLNLPESARRTTVLAVLASANMILRTVSAFIESETPGVSIARMTGRGINAMRRAADSTAIEAALKATRF